MKDFLYIVEQHGGKIATAGALLYAAIVTSLPADRKDFNWYDFFYSVTHALLPVRVRVEKPHA